MTTAGVPQLYMCVSSKVTTQHAFGALNFSSDRDLGLVENKQSELYLGCCCGKSVDLRKGL